METILGGVRSQLEPAPAVPTAEPWSETPSCQAGRKRCRVRGCPRSAPGRVWCVGGCLHLRKKNHDYLGEIQEWEEAKILWKNFPCSQVSTLGGSENKGWAMGAPWTDGGGSGDSYPANMLKRALEEGVTICCPECRLGSRREFGKAGVVKPIALCPVTGCVCVTGAPRQGGRLTQGLKCLPQIDWNTLRREAISHPKVSRNWSGAGCQYFKHQVNTAAWFCPWSDWSCQPPHFCDTLG